MAATHGKFGALYKWDSTSENLAAEACTVVANDAQITDAAKRLLNPNCTDLLFTPTNAVSLLKIDLLIGKAYFDGAPGVTTCAGTGAYIDQTTDLIKTAYLFNWTLDVVLQAAEKTEFQADWKAFDPGLAEASGSIEGYLVGSNWWDDVEDLVDGTQKAAWLLRLFSYDPDDDMTGDHYDMWAVLSGFGINVPVGELVKETITFQVTGGINFTANV